MSQTLDASNHEFCRIRHTQLEISTFTSPCYKDIAVLAETETEKNPKFNSNNFCLEKVRLMKYLSESLIVQ